MSTTWTLSGSYSGWQRLRVLTPYDLVSNPANFSLTCGPVVVYDLVAKASLAHWLTGAPSTDIPFNGSDGDSRGFAISRSNFLLNDGSRPSLCLETHPKWVDNGFIQGAFTDIYTSGYTVQASDHISGKVGFGSGGAAGNVTFRIMIRTSSSGNNWIMSLPLAYAQGVKPFDIALNTYVGQKADFILQVDAGATAAQDWAVWQDVKITR